MFFIRATKRSSYLRDNTFISQLFQDPNIRPGLGDRTPWVPKGLFTHEPGFWDLAVTTSKSWVKFLMFSYEETGWLDSRDLAFFNRDLGKWVESCAIWTLYWARLPGWDLEWDKFFCNRAAWMASSCFACCIFHIISIPFDCSCQSYNIIIIFVFHH